MHKIEPQEESLPPYESATGNEINPKPCHFIEKVLKFEMSTSNLTLFGACAGTFLAGIIAGAAFRATPTKPAEPATPVVASKPSEAPKPAPAAPLFEDRLTTSDSEDASDDEGSDDGREPYKMVCRRYFHQNG